MTLLEQGYQLSGGNAGDANDAGGAGGAGGARHAQHAQHTVMFLKTINGESVDWTYGAALYKGRNPVPKSLRGVWVCMVVCLVVGVGHGRW